MNYLKRLKDNFFDREDCEMKLILIFRYISLFCSTLFFLFENTSQGIDKKIITIICIFISSTILAYLYYKNRNMRGILRVLVFIETIGNSIILLPTGGFNSPYLWYFINSILIAAFFIGRIESLISGMIYILSSFVSLYIYWDFNIKAFGNAVKIQPNIILSIMLMTGAVWIISLVINKMKVEGKKLLYMNKELEEANRKASESMEEIMALYQAMDVVFDKHNKEEIIKVLLQHTCSITKSKGAFYKSKDGNMLLNNECETDGISNIEREITQRVDKMNFHINTGSNPKEIIIKDKKIAIIGIKSAYNYYGALGIDISDFQSDIISQQNINQLKFIGKLGSMALEKCNIETVNERLIVTEERNRIADEIHDSVLQRLFGMSCSIYGIMKNIENLDNKEKINGLNDIRITTNDVMKELRGTIYGMSWKKDGENTFINDIKSHIKEAEKSMDVNIDFKIDDNHECLNVREKKAFYRIISEGVGNAIKHGRAKNIIVDIFINERKKELCILDDGNGFSVEEFTIKENRGGMGLKNIKNLACLLGGKASIKSLEGVGTEIKIMVPRELNSKGECEVI